MYCNVYYNYPIAVNYYGAKLQTNGPVDICIYYCILHSSLSVMHMLALSLAHKHSTK